MADVRTVLAPNAGPMTLDGTNTYVLSGVAGASVIIDPGPDDADHLAILATSGPALVLITHHHSDHTEASSTIHRMTGAPVRALDPAYCIGGNPLTDGELIYAAGVRIRVVATPGHTADSVCLLLPDGGAVLTGDTILGRGSTVIVGGDGSLGEYMHSLESLRELGNLTVLPGHGPHLPSLAEACTRLLDLRQQRLSEVRAVLARLGVEGVQNTKTATTGVARTGSAAAGQVSSRAFPLELVAQVTDTVYPDVDPRIRFAAEHSVHAQLEFLFATTTTRTCTTPPRD
ncbi:putative hydrolase [marine actinobacterium PHSC20C1]|nr:putative hydrolase [marine actinobacterium PHSC20C1]